MLTAAVDGTFSQTSKYKLDPSVKRSVKEERRKKKQSSGRSGNIQFLGGGPVYLQFGNFATIFNNLSPAPIILFSKPRSHRRTSRQDRQS